MLVALLLTQLIQEAAYGETSPLGSSLYAPSLKALAVPDVLAYRSTHFVKSNIIVTANGISNDRLKEIIDAKGHLIPDGPTTPAVALAPSPYVGGDIKVRVPLSGTSHVALAFPVPSGDAGITLDGVIITTIHSFISYIRNYRFYNSQAILGTEGLAGCEDLRAAHLRNPLLILVRRVLWRPAGSAGLGYCLDHYWVLGGYRRRVEIHRPCMP